MNTKETFPTRTFDVTIGSVRIKGGLTKNILTPCSDPKGEEIIETSAEVTFYGVWAQAKNDTRVFNTAKVIGTVKDLENDWPECVKQIIIECTKYFSLKPPT